jgi:hypothetical protein
MKAMPGPSGGGDLHMSFRFLPGGARVAGGFLPPGGGKNLAHQSMLIGMGPSKCGLRRGQRYIRTKRAAADLAATGELIRGMPRRRGALAGSLHPEGSIWTPFLER